MQQHRLWLVGGIVGIVGTLCYLAAILIDWPETQAGTSVAMLTVSAWPILAVIYSYALHEYIAAERPGAANRLAFAFSLVAFPTVLAMIHVQVAIDAGVSEMTAGLPEETVTGIRRALRLVDFGLDVAWDMLIGTALILFGLAMWRRRGLGMGWAVPSLGFGAALIGLNLATFPWPPASRGLFDIGPFIAIYIVALAARLTVAGARDASTPRARAGVTVP